MSLVTTLVQNNNREITDVDLFVVIIVVIVILLYILLESSLLQRKSIKVKISSQVLCALGKHPRTCTLVRSSRMKLLKTLAKAKPYRKKIDVTHANCTWCGRGDGSWDRMGEMSWKLLSLNLLVRQGRCRVCR